MRAKNPPELRLDGDTTVSGERRHSKTTLRLFHGLEGRAGAHVDADVVELLSEPTDEVGIELREHTIGALQAP